MKSASLSLPNQLFNQGPPATKNDKVYLVEEDRYFRDFNFHLKKIFFHRSSMKGYQKKLEKDGYSVTYVPNFRGETLNKLFKELKQDGVRELFYYDPVDHKLSKQIKALSEKFEIIPVKKSNPAFITKMDDFKEIFPDGNYKMSKFYQHQRRKLNVLMEDGNPKGGKWSFDKKNRQKLPKGVKVPSLPAFSSENRQIGRAHV